MSTTNSNACEADGAPAKNDWENPDVTEINRLPPRTYAMPLADEASALSDALDPETPYAISLNGDWKIKWVGDPARCPPNFWRTDFDDSDWAAIDVPSCVEMRGDGRGVRFSASEPLFVQALHYGWEDLAYSRHINGQRRMRAPLVPREEICLNLDVRQTGLGGASCGPRPLGKYRFDPNAPIEWTCSIGAAEDNRT